MVTPPFNFQKWIEENRHLLKPPVGNKCMVDGDLIVMVVGGPNARKDYHFDKGAEFFYQIEGDITVKIIDEGKPKNMHIKQGEMFYLPPEVPHSPQRPANTIGLVIERKRDEEERKILLEIGLKKMNEKEEDDFIPIGYRTRRVKIFKK